MRAHAPARNARTGFVLAGVAAGMIGLSFAAVPLYRMFCQVTGFGGTTQVADAAPATVRGRIVKVRLDARVNSRLPWRFQPVQRQITLRVGESKTARFRARNLADYPVTGTATFNVTPLKAGRYFSKVQCFCFDEQRLAPGEEVEMAVQFFIDPKIMDDRNMDDVRTITLSYTFFHARGDAEQEADGGRASRRRFSTQALVRQKAER